MYLFDTLYQMDHTRPQLQTYGREQDGDQCNLMLKKVEMDWIHSHEVTRHKHD
uniref:Uncharacterized protein n=1 Tax=Arion vulgaris TaxID=1028688 RepID=A0A0B7BE06_9EUPU